MDAIKTSNLVKKYDEKIVVNNLNLKIKQGSLYALLGVNGAGKTTTIKMLSGLIKSTSGAINILDMDMNKETDKIKEIINISPQETAVALNLTVMENLKFMAGVYHIKNKEEKINSLIKTFHLEDILTKKTKKLSGGMMRNLSIALSLINDPQVLFLDEPTLGLDVLARHNLWDIIQSLKGTMTIILTTHYMEEAETLADTIGIMQEGKMLIEGTSKELIQKAKAQNFEDAFIYFVKGENHANN